MAKLNIFLIVMLLTFNAYAQTTAPDLPEDTQIIMQIRDKAKKADRALQNLWREQYRAFMWYYEQGCEGAQQIANLTPNAAKWFIDSSKTSDFLVDDMQVVNAERLVPPCDISIDMDTGTVSITGTFTGWYEDGDI